ncbi:NUDIX domain-containing protein [Candidatus Woesearchaeota archaeon]|nr:NUDIX domain-containing protein [Candidatus Woesearchaeota archaeon]
MAEEVIDLVDENGKPTNQIESKRAAHQKGLRHQSSHVWIYNPQGKVLLQKRSVNKDSWPGLWDVSAAGHVIHGETPKEAAVREVFEETGLKINPKDLEYLGVDKVSRIIPKVNWTNNEFYHIYLLKFNGKAEQLRLQKEDVEKVEFFTIDKIEKDLKDSKENKKYVPHGEYYHKIFKLVREKTGKQE